ncbi:MAG: tetratricopeptide repeat protein [Burkholderiales bacterium]|nr:tetratricopeptide repeat protein [Burkholderiales bacterium]
MEGAEALRLIEEGNAIEDAGRFAEALARYERAIAMAPQLARGHLNRGNVLLAMGDASGAVAAYSAALSIEPHSAGVHFNLGNAYVRLGRQPSALAAYGRALELKPDFVDAELAIGNAMADAGRLDDAAESYRRALSIAPNFAHSHYNLGLVLQTLGRLDEAVASHRRATEIDPSLASAHYHLGLALRESGRLEDAVHSLRQATSLRPDYIEAHYNLSAPLRSLGKLDEAEASLRRVLELDPVHVHAHAGLGMVLEDAMRLADAQTSYRRALSIDPDFLPAHNGLLFCISHDEAVDSAALVAAHRKFGQRFAELGERRAHHANGRDPGRILQVGFVSGDLRSHAVASFVEPIVAALARSPALALHAYYNWPAEDAITARIRALIRHWHPICGLPDDELALRIAADRIDILVDLSGHTGANRLLTFARKPAPVQVSWIGYPGTTGLAAMDYYLGDPHFLPPGQFDAQFVERIVYLPAVAPFRPLESAPAVNPLPAAWRGYVTFGSFNRSSKLSRSVIALWSRVLRDLPEARLLVAGMPQHADPATLIDWFEAQGVSRTRLRFHGRCDIATYLRLHHEVDLCLDTYPYTGGTTTVNALWMGVPTLTVAGPTPASRQSAAMLGHAGLADFVATGVEDFAAKAVRWAGDPARLARLRAGLRARIEQSTLRQPEVIAAGIERAFRMMWQRWCAGLPPETLNVSGAHEAEDA